MGKHSYNISTLPVDAPRADEEIIDAEVVEEAPQPELITLTSEALTELLENYAVSIRRETVRTTFELVQDVLHKVLTDTASADEVDTVRARLLQLLDETIDSLKNDNDSAYAELQEKSEAAFYDKYGASLNGENLQPE